jgi:Cofactor assembly of complex C subunit B
MPHMHLSLAGQVTQPVTFQAGTRRARQLFAYMKNYNYTVKSTGEVITFAGNYRSRRGQAAAITFYMLMGMLSCGLVLSIAAPGGAFWYSLVLLTPLAPWYYYRNADRCALRSQGVLC